MTQDHRAAPVAIVASAKSTHALALAIIRELHGYRQNSLRRVDDVDWLALVLDKVYIGAHTGQWPNK